MQDNYSSQDARGVFAVPPLARRSDRTIDFEANERIIAHIARAGITRFIYGGNAFLYHVTLADYEQLLEWLAGLPDELLCIPSAGPSFGRAIDQARLVREYGFPLVMMLPCADPRDALGLESGIREFADVSGSRLMLYVKDEGNFGDREAGLEALGRLAASGVCAAIKYAIVRQEPGKDDYLAELLRRVDRDIVISGIGERPAIVHLREAGLPGFTTGSGCLAPALSQALYVACAEGDDAAARDLREEFLPLEDLREAWGPARVLHAAVEAAGICRTGPIPRFVSARSVRQLEQLRQPVSMLFHRAESFKPNASGKAAVRT
jgi:4-hydroxy-tetrahydrodipicolinate synthase